MQSHFIHLAAPHLQQYIYYRRRLGYNQPVEIMPYRDFSRLKILRFMHYLIANTGEIPVVGPLFIMIFHTSAS